MELIEVIRESAADEVAIKAFVQGEMATLKNEFANVKRELIKEIRDSKYAIIKWMFTFWVSTIGIALLLYFLKK